MASTANDTDGHHTEDSRSDADIDRADDVAVLDPESAEDQEERIEALEARFREQEAAIQGLQDRLLDLSTRVADDRGVGVCRDCHGPDVTVRGWFRPTSIGCKRCGRTPTSIDNA